MVTRCHLQGVPKSHVLGGGRVKESGGYVVCSVRSNASWMMVAWDFPREQTGACENFSFLNFVFETLKPCDYLSRLVSRRPG